MKIKNAIRFFAAAMVTGVLAAPLLVTGAGCGKSDCDQLNDECTACTGMAGTQSGKQACLSVVQAGNQDLCKAALPSFTASGALCK